MKCSRCGFENPDGLDYCKRCGKSLNNPVSDNRRNISNSKHPENVSNPNKKDNSIYYMVGIGLIVVLLIGAAVALSFNNPGTNSTNNSTASPSKGLVPYTNHVTGSGVSQEDNNDGENLTSPVNDSSIQENVSSMVNDTTNSSVASIFREENDSNSLKNNIVQGVNDSLSSSNVNVDDLAGLVESAPSGFTSVDTGDANISTDDVTYLLASNILDHSSSSDTSSVSGDSNMITSSEYDNMASEVVNSIQENGNVPSSVEFGDNGASLSHDEYVKLFAYIVSHGFPSEVDLNNI
ncbi:hypothetical protein ACA135_03885 [Methanobrevibacter acididurans]|uniref:hypothetical protein n=1 Tax=Methanobrevibacter acididurans TaxID=120963 RepID=UPI0038FC6F5D